jgi:hypothetical protein
VFGKAESGPANTPSLQFFPGRSASGLGRGFFCHFERWREILLALLQFSFLQSATKEERFLPAVEMTEARVSLAPFA